MNNVEVKIPATHINAMLNGIRYAAKPVFDQIIDTTPWRRYKDNPPPDDPTLMIEVGDELAILHRQLYLMLGASLYMACALQAGNEFVKATTGPQMQAFRTEIAKLDGVARLHAIGAMMAASLRDSVARGRVVNTEQGVIIELNNCLECQYLEVSQPFCYFVLDAYKLTFARLTNLRLKAVELDCRGTGSGKQCRYAIMLT